MNVNARDPAWAGGADPSASAAQNTAAFQAAYDAITASGGEFVIPPGSYQGSFKMNATKPVRVIGDGVTLLPPANTVGIEVTSGNGMNGIKGVVIESLLIDGGGGVGQQVGTTGIKINNSDWVKLRNVKTQKCVKGIHYLASGTGWCEASSAESCAVYECDTGIRYENTGSSGSFAECALRDVGINSCTICIDTSGNNGAGLLRSTFDNVTMWLARTGDTGIKLGTQTVGSLWRVAFEGVVVSKAFDVTTNYDNGVIPVSNFNGGSIVKATVAAGLTLEWQEGHTRYVARGAGAAVGTQIGIRDSGDSIDRVALSGGPNPGMTLRDGSNAVAVYQNGPRIQSDSVASLASGVVNKTKAGAPVDGDFDGGASALNGLIVVDSTNNKIWARVGGVWKGVVIA